MCVKHPTYTLVVCSVNLPDKHGYTPLHCATHDRCGEDVLVCHDVLCVCVRGRSM
jgi:hypothetical protein